MTYTPLGSLTVLGNRIIGLNEGLLLFRAGTRLGRSAADGKDPPNGTPKRGSYRGPSKTQSEFGNRCTDTILVQLFIDNILNDDKHAGGQTSRDNKQE